jgi:hypothetical protein
MMLSPDPGYRLEWLSGLSFRLQPNARALVFNYTAGGILKNTTFAPNSSLGWLPSLLLPAYPGARAAEETSILPISIWRR